MFPKFVARETLSFLLSLVLLDRFRTDRGGHLGRITYVRVGGSGGDDALRLAGCEAHASDKANHHQ